MSCYGKFAADKYQPALERSFDILHVLNGSCLVHLGLNLLQCRNYT